VSLAVASRRHRDLPARMRTPLRHMLLDSLRRGHGKVAAQRYLMLTYIEVNVPPEVEQVCEATLSRMTPRESRRAHDAAAAWAAITGRRARWRMAWRE
jgi:hypothetical protein